MDRTGDSELITVSHWIDWFRFQSAASVMKMKIVLVVSGSVRWEVFE